MDSLKHTWKSLSKKLRNTIAHPTSVKISKIANGAIKIASYLGQSNLKGPLAATSAALGALNVVVESLDIEPDSSVDSYIKENRLKGLISGLGQCIMQQVDMVNTMGTKVLASDKSRFLTGITINNEIFAFEVRNGHLGLDVTTSCYHSLDFDFNWLTNNLWKSLGPVADITWDERWWIAGVAPSLLRETDYLGQHRPEKIAKEIEEFHKREISYAAVLYGPPGTGKTTYVHKYAKIIGGRMVIIRPDIVENLSNNKAEALFDALHPQILLLDDVDRIDKGLTKLMAFVETIRHKYPNMVLFATCNSIPKNPALMRPGRLGQLLAFKSPTEKEKKELLEHYMKIYNVDSNLLDLDILIKEMNHAKFSHDYVRFVSERAAFMTQNRLVELIKDLIVQLS